jgi:hypothetical protein
LFEGSVDEVDEVEEIEGEELDGGEIEANGLEGEMEGSDDRLLGEIEDGLLGDIEGLTSGN